MRCPECEEEIPGQLSETYGCCDHCVGHLEEIERGGPKALPSCPTADRPAVQAQP